jgi:chromosome segregation ATPase
MPKKLAPSTAAVLDPDDAEQDILVFDAAEEFMSRSGPAAPLEEDMQARVKEAHEELLQLRLRQEEIERQKDHLELIREKQERFAKGKRDIGERLNQATVTLESELYTAQKLVQELSTTVDTYSKHLDNLRDMHPEKWSRAHVEEELDHCIVLIAEAESDFSKCTRRLAGVRPVENATEREVLTATTNTALSAEEDLRVWAKRGFAFTLPLIATLIVGLILARLMF